MTTKTDEQLRADFEAWQRKHYDYDDLAAFEIEFAFAAFQAGRASQQSQDREDTARLDWLDSMNAKLNSRYGTTYRWELVLSPHVVRLMAGCGGSGHVAAIDLNDSAANGVPSCREAIDHARRVEGERG